MHKRLPPDGIRDAFNAKQEKLRKEWETYGLPAALRGLSDAIADIREAGLDVSLTMEGDASEMAFELFENNGSLVVPVSGILRVGDIHVLLAIATQVSSEPALVLAISRFDIRFHGTQATTKDGRITNRIRGDSFDLKNDPEALVKFQQAVITSCVRSAEVARNDVAHAFGDRPARDVLPKPARKRPPNTP